MKRKRLNRDTLDTALLFTPGFVVYLGFMILPIILCVYYSFFDWDGIMPTMHFVGLDNFVNAIRDRDFLNSLRVTAFFTIPGTIIVNALGILFAILVNRKGAMTNFYRSVFFFPLLISAVAIGFIWKSLLSYDGIINTMLAKIGVQAIDFIGSPKLAPWSMLFINIWHDTGFVTVLYLAGLQAIPTDLYDSARIDGASGGQQFIRITFPWLAPAFTACVVFLFTGYMRMFDLVMVMTSGGPAGATQTVAYQVIFVGFTRNMLSYGSSLAIYMLVLISIVSVTLTYYLRKREEKLIM
ncbi:MAG: sugar ABC transporter permease [Spirochaetia bacterium]|jgi:ABC-type sugar transport system permease subunit